MTTKEIEQILTKLLSMVNSMNKNQTEKLLNILVSSGEQRCCTFFKYFDTKTQVKKLLGSALKSKKILHMFSKNQVKQMYELMGDLQQYPICALCGQPIKIDSTTTKFTKQTNPLVFSWDHIYPKSLGGSNDLQNLQPAHKICNNLKGSKVLYTEHYTITVDIDINTEHNLVNQRYRRIRPTLRKQDSWCHKQRNQYHR